MKTIYRIRDRVLPAIRGHSKFAYQEFVPDDIDTSKIPYGRIFKRAEWGAAPATARYWKLSHPVLYVKTVFLALQSEDGKGLEEGLKGVEAVRMFQKLDMKNGMIDIRSNFIIDEDGLIYEGRGWYAQPGFDEDNPDHKKLNQQYLEICYIGDHHAYEHNHPMNFAAAKLMYIGNTNKYFVKNTLLLKPEGWLYERQRPPRKVDLLPPT